MKNVFTICAVLVSWLWFVGYIFGFVFRPFYRGCIDGFNTAALMAQKDNTQRILDAQKEFNNG